MKNKILITITASLLALLFIGAGNISPDRSSPLGYIIATEGKWVGGTHYGNGSGLTNIPASGLSSLGADPNADRIVFWDDSDGSLKYLTAGSGLSLSGTTLTATGGTLPAAPAVASVLTNNVGDTPGYFPIASLPAGSGAGFWVTNIAAAGTFTNLFGDYWEATANNILRFNASGDTTTTISGDISRFAYGVFVDVADAGDTYYIGKNSGGAAVGGFNLKDGVVEDLTATTVTVANGSDGLVQINNSGGDNKIRLSGAAGVSQFASTIYQTNLTAGQVMVVDGLKGHTNLPAPGANSVLTNSSGGSAGWFPVSALSGSVGSQYMVTNEINRVFVMTNDVLNQKTMALITADSISLTNSTTRYVIITNGTIETSGNIQSRASVHGQTSVSGYFENISMGEFGLTMFGPTMKLRNAAGWELESLADGVGVGMYATSALTNIYAQSFVATPGATVTLAADNQVVGAATNSVIVMASDDGTAGNRTFVLTTGVPGKTITLTWTGTNAGELVDDAANTGAGNVRLSATWTPTQYDTLTVVGVGNDWHEVSRSAN